MRILNNRIGIDKQHSIHIAILLFPYLLRSGSIREAKNEQTLFELTMADRITIKGAHLSVPKFCTKAVGEYGKDAIPTLHNILTILSLFFCRLLL